MSNFGLLPEWIGLKIQSVGAEGCRARVVERERSGELAELDTHSPIKANNGLILSLSYLAYRPIPHLQSAA